MTTPAAPPPAPSRRAKARRFLLLAGANLLFLVIFAELLALVYLYATTGRIYYLTRLPPTTAAIPNLSAAQEDEATALALRNRLTPLGGHITMQPNQQAGLFYVNNYGFRSLYGDYPTPPATDDQVVVGIFGGSVATQIYTIGYPAIVATLQQDPRYQDKEIIILSFCLPGYKQPAQLTMFNYFLSIGQQIDIVVNLDGFNEVALAAVNQRLGVSPTLFSASHTVQARGLINEANLSPQKIDLLYALSTTRARVVDLRRRQAGTRSAAVYFVLAQLIHRYDNQYQRASAVFEALPVVADDSIIYMPPADPELTPAAVLQLAADQWAEASRLMHEVAQSRGIQYVHILQTNQYYSDREFGDEEAAVALNPDQPYRPAVIDGYPLLVAAGRQLRAEGIAFFDSSPVFDDLSGAAYRDDCCHYTDEGIELMAIYIGQAILAGD